MYDVSISLQAHLRLFLCRTARKTGRQSSRTIIRITTADSWITRRLRVRTRAQITRGEEKEVVEDVNDRYPETCNSKRSLKRESPKMASSLSSSAKIFPGLIDPRIYRYNSIHERQEKLMDRNAYRPLRTAPNPLAYVHREFPNFESQVADSDRDAIFRVSGNFSFRFSFFCFSLLSYSLFSYIKSTAGKDEESK